MAARAALVEGSDPDRVPEHDLLRERRLRDRDGLARLLRQACVRAHAPGGGTPRRHAGQPGRLRPGSEPEAAKARRKTVLGLMLEQGLITATDYRAADESPLPRAAGDRPSGLEGPSRLLRRVRQAAARALLRLRRRLRRRAQDLHLDRPRVAEARARGDRQWLPGSRGPDAALVAIDPRDGRVLAMVGGESFEKSQFNLAVQGQRQTGSAFKPFVLTAAVEQGISPQTVFTSEPTVINLGDKLWSVSNYEGSYLGSIDLQEGLSTPTTRSMRSSRRWAERGRHGAQARRDPAARRLLRHRARRRGRQPAGDGAGIRRSPTTASGSTARCSATCRAVLVETGRERGRQRPVEARRGRNDAALVNSILGARHRGNGPARRPRRPARGRRTTGTTENYGDAWFVGYTPQLAVASGSATRDGWPMETEFEGDPVAGGTSGPDLEDVRREGARPPRGAAGGRIRLTRASSPARSSTATTRSLLDNGNCKGARQILYFVGLGPSAEADCKPNEVDVPNVVGMRLAAARDRLYSMPLTADVVWRPGAGRGAARACNP